MVHCQLSYLKVCVCQIRYSDTAHVVGRKNNGLMSSDGVHQNDIVTDIFVSGLQEGIGQALVLLGGGRTPCRLTRGPS